MPKLSRLTKTVLAGGAAIIGIGATNHAHTTRIAPLTGGSSTSTQKSNRSSASSSISHSEKEYAEICYDPDSGQRLENSECEDGGGSSGSSGGSAHYFGSSSGRRGRNYWMPYSNSSTLPKVGERVTGGFTARPTDGTIFRNLPAQGGGFAESFRESKSSYTVENSQVKSTQQGDSHGSFNQDAQKKTTPKKSRGGFGGGSKTGGGTKGG